LFILLYTLIIRLLASRHLSILGSTDLYIQRYPRPQPQFLRKARQEANRLDPEPWRTYAKEEEEEEEEEEAESFSSKHRYGSDFLFVSANALFVAESFCQLPASAR
jgi:hypothetical protein